MTDNNMNYENNDEKVKAVLESEKLPEELSPQNIQKMLDEKAPQNRRKQIKHTAARVTAGAAACAVICGFGVHFAGQRNNNKFNNDEKTGIDASSVVTGTEVTQKVPEADLKEAEPVQYSYMNHADEYGEIYYKMEQNYLKSQEKLKKSQNSYNVYMEEADDDIAYDEGADEVYGAESSYSFTENDVKDIQSAEAAPSDDVNGSIQSGSSEDGDDYYTTHNQEEGVLEADKAKTDGKNIYYLYNSYDYNSGNGAVPVVNIAAADNGQFGESATINIAENLECGDASNSDISVQDMYIYDDMLILIGAVSVYDYSYTNALVDIDEDAAVEDVCCGCWGAVDSTTFVSFYTLGTSPEFIGSYYQDGSYSDVRITPDGYMYLVTNYSSRAYDQIKDMNDIESYIPYCSQNSERCPVAPENILIPEGGEIEAPVINYAVTGSIDLTQSGQFTNVETKALAGFSGQIYCTDSNLYVAEEVYSSDYTTSSTAITRIALSQGSISPEASGTVEGYVNDQFSMSEYNGYFRIATTISESELYDDGWGEYWEFAGYDNAMTILDASNLEQTGCLKGFGEDEMIRSASFSGDTAYVVTFRQTDPLFSFDLSDPTDPKILDELEMPGYSSYMQQWGDGMLLGCGVNANENGVTDGVKLSMYDNADPNNLAELDSFIFDTAYFTDGGNYESYDWVYSASTDDRKALMAAPEKNIIAMPVCHEHTDYNGDWAVNNMYCFLSFEDGKFSLLGSISESTDNFKDGSFLFDRAVYIGDYAYVLSGSKFVSTSLDDITETDSVEFCVPDDSFTGYIE